MYKHVVKHRYVKTLWNINSLLNDEIYLRSEAFQIYFTNIWEGGVL